MEKGEKRGDSYFSISLFYTFIVFGILVSSISPIRNIQVSNAHPGEYAELRASIVNEFNYDLKGLNLVAIGMDIDTYAKAASFDVDGKNAKAKSLLLPIDKSVKPGDYLIKITLSNDKIKKAKYRYITVN